MSLANELFEEISEFEFTENQRASLILMSPESFRQLKLESFGKGLILNELKFMGLPIYRTLDLKEGKKFKVG